MLDTDAERYLARRKRESALSQAGALTPETLRTEEQRLRSRYGHGPRMRTETIVPTEKGIPRYYILDPHFQPVGVLIYFHGGGWVMGEPEDYLAVCRAIAKESGWRVVVADYRKAPEHPFPAAFDDALNLVRHFAARRDFESRMRSLPLGVGGDSAGGNLAAAVSAYLGVSDPGALAVQVLITPVLDGNLDTPSYRDPSRQLTLTRDAMAWFLDQYIALAHRSDERFAVLRASEPAALPPTIFVSVGTDVLFSEGRDYIERLEGAGIEVQHREYPGQMHGFFQLYTVMESSKDAIKWISSALQNIATDKAAMQPTKGTVK